MQPGLRAGLAGQCGWRRSGREQAVPHLGHLGEQRIGDLLTEKCGWWNCITPLRSHHRSPDGPGSRSMIVTSCPRRASAIPVYRPVGPAPTMTARMPVPLFFPPLPRRRNRRTTATPANGQASAQPHRGESLTLIQRRSRDGAAARSRSRRSNRRVWPDHPPCTRSTAGHRETGCLPDVTGGHDPDRGGLHLISIWSPQHLHRLCMVLDLARHEGCHVVRATCRMGQPGGGRGCPILFLISQAVTCPWSPPPFTPSRAHSWDQRRRR